MSANDPIHWVDQWGWTLDPRLLPQNPLVPFELFPRQREFLEWLRARETAKEDGLVEKSRDMGLTWLCATYALHGWLFRPGFVCGFGSRVTSLVDTIGDPDSILEKVRILLRNLPSWMLPAKWRAAEHDNYCKILNPETGAVINGQGGDDIGRGGRASIFFVDEAAHLQHPQLVEAALSQTSQCRIWVSTPAGLGNPFAKKRHGGVISVFTFHWKDDPRKNRWEKRGASGEVIVTGCGRVESVGDGETVVYPWYEAECRRLEDPVVIAQELDIDYSASVEGICIPAAWVRAAVELPITGSQQVIAGLDVAEEGKNKNVLVARRGPVVKWPIDWSGGNTTQTAMRAADEAEKAGAQILNYDSIGVGAGIRGALNSTERRLRFAPFAVNVGTSPTETYWPDGKTSKERFLNLKIELWWLVRTRFEKAYEYRLFLQGDPRGKKHPAEEMISIPNDPRLISQLSLPRVFSTETGKMKLESKEQLARRGVASPDFAEALMLSFAPTQVINSGGKAGGERPILKRLEQGPVPGSMRF